VHCGLEDKTGNIWFASDYGKYIGDTLGGVWRSNFSDGKTEEQEFTKYSTKEAFFLMEDKVGYIWVGTRNTGLYRYEGEMFTSFSE
jgi:ligand-binding sensor domain-containing protein